MEERMTHAVTGAFGFSGKYIARRLINKGRKVETLTNSSHRPDPFGGKVEARPLDFANPGKLEESLRGVSVLYNTYWVRFNHKSFTHSDAVKNTITLFDCAKRAGVERIVHVSITNPDEHSRLEYFHGKGRLERALRETGISHAILRPAVLFGKEDILINNIAWALRKFPVFGVFGDGEYRIQPIHADDLAALAVEQGESRENTVIEAIGPETFTYKGLVETIGKIIGKKRPIVSVNPGFGYIVGKIVGSVMNDIFITREEIEGLMDDLLYVDSPPAGKTVLTKWAKENAGTLGGKYASELGRRRKKT